MDRITLTPFETPFQATITPPGSKSLTNRALVIAAAAACAAVLAAEMGTKGAASLLQLAVGGVVFAISPLLGVRLIGDPPIREAIARAASIRRRSNGSRG